MSAPIAPIERAPARTVDCAIIGGGPAGLVAALYLLRFRRSVIIADRGSGRANLIPRSHNVPGFPEGIAGTDLLERLWTQVRKHGTPDRMGEVDTLAPELEQSRWKVRSGDHEVRVRTVLLATGVKDRWPAIVGAEGALQRRVLRFCPICDGHEIGTAGPVAVVGNDDHALREASFLQSYCPDVWVLGSAPRFSATARDQALARGIRLVEIDEGSATFEPEGLATRDASSQALPLFPVVYGALGVDPQVVLLNGLGVRQDRSGHVEVDLHQRTSRRGIYAAGDVVRGLSQISVALGEAAIAATTIHNDLRESGH